MFNYSLSIKNHSRKRKGETISIYPAGNRTRDVRMIRTTTVDKFNIGKGISTYYVS